MSAAPGSGIDDAFAAQQPCFDAWLLAALLAIDPPQLGGLRLRARPGAVRDAWLRRLKQLLPPEAPLRRVPHHITDERLLGGLDLTATLREARPVGERGVLVCSDGGVVLLAMSERIAVSSAARIAAAMDAGAVALERDGLTERHAARFAVVLLDEGIDDEQPPQVLLERCAFSISLDGIAMRDLAAAEAWGEAETLEQITAARSTWQTVRVNASTRRAICGTALACGVHSMRVPLFALRVARMLAALAGRQAVMPDDAAQAARLVIAPRATHLPPPQDAAPPEPPPPQPSPGDPDEAADSDRDQQLEDRVLDATVAALPAGLLALLGAGIARRTTPRSASSRAGAELRSQQRGRPIAARPGPLRGAARLHLIDTLRAAAPWQPLRRRERDVGTRIDVRPEDFRIRRFRQRSQTTLIFVVDASGSAALHRLAEAKGAVELMLADCYVRRDQVALIAFRGKTAELLLPPTRSLSRAKRCLASLPGGGGTPLAAGVDAATALAELVRRRGDTPLLVMLTDGRGNIARDGTPGRPAAERDALAAARALRATEVSTLLIDSAPTPHPAAQQLALEMRARYLALPHADARRINEAVQASRD